MVKSASALCELNLELMRCGRFKLGIKNHRVLQVNPLTGVYTFQVPAKAANLVCEFVTNPANRSIPNGHLVLQGRAFPGYDGYIGTEALHHDGRLQSSFTSAIGKDFIPMAVEAVPGLLDIVVHVCRELGARQKNVHIIHFLLQANPISVFSWHDDAFDLRMPRRMVTAIVSLNEVPSCMEVWGFQPAWFTGQGSAVAFPGGARHRSVRGEFASEVNNDVTARSNGPVKLAIFFTP